MSYRLAKAQIVTVIEGTILEHTGVAALGDSLFHRKANGPASTARVGRSFHLWAGSGGDVGAFHRGIREAALDVEIVIFYPEMQNDGDLMDVLIESDRTCMCARLEEPSLWDRPASAIINLAVSGERFLPFTRRQVPGGWELSQMLLVQYRGLVSTAGK